MLKKLLAFTILTLSFSSNAALINRGGFQGGANTEGSGNPKYHYVWAVRDGDVAAVPVPAAA